MMMIMVMSVKEDLLSYAKGSVELSNVLTRMIMCSAKSI